MILIQEIIDNLSSNSPNLNNALFKTKVLLHRLGENQLISWVDSELNGYPNIETVPDYRIINLSVHGNASNMAWRFSDHPLPLSHLDKELRKKLENHYLIQSIAVIESYANKDDTDLTISITPEFFPLLSEGLSGGYRVERAWGKPSAGCMLQVVTEVRSRLLDFILELSDKIPKNLNESEMKEKSKEIGTSELFRNAVFGDNASIVVGDHNVQRIKNNIIQNDIESLANELRKHSVADEDIEALKEAINKDNDSPEHKKKKFGKNVRLWISSMLTKATESAWNVELGIASGLITNALTAYYGWF